MIFVWNLKNQVLRVVSNLDRGIRIECVPRHAHFNRIHLTNSETNIVNNVRGVEPREKVRRNAGRNDGGKNMKRRGGCDGIANNFQVTHGR